MWAMLDTSAAAIDRIEAALRDANSESYLWEMVERGSVYTGNVHVAARVARLLLRPPASEATRRGALLNVAFLEAARGRFRLADSLLAHPQGLAPETFTLVRAALASVPHSTLDRSTLTELSRRLGSWDATTADTTDRNAPYNGLTSRFRPVFAGALAMRLGLREGERHLAALRRLDGGTDDVALARAYEGWLAAEVLLASGDAIRARDRLVQTEPSLSLGAMHTMLGAHAPVRWLRAESLRRAGQAREALSWYESIVGTTAFETPYLAPAHLESARILEALGHTTGALRHYQRFVFTWRECEPELRPMVQAAMARIQVLESKK
jgi:hypothetical protein